MCASQGLKKNAATAICKEMGYNSSVEYETGDKWNVQNTYSIKMGDVTCGNSFWFTCTYLNSPDCDPYHRDDIFLTCKRSESASNIKSIFSNYFTSSISQVYANKSILILKNVPESS